MHPPSVPILLTRIVVSVPGSIMHHMLHTSHLNRAYCMMDDDGCLDDKCMMEPSRCVCSSVASNSTGFHMMVSTLKKYSLQAVVQYECKHFLEASHFTWLTLNLEHLGNAPNFEPLETALANQASPAAPSSQLPFRSGVLVVVWQNWIALDRKMMNEWMNEWMDESMRWQCHKTCSHVSQANVILILITKIVITSTTTITTNENDHDLVPHACINQTLTTYSITYPDHRPNITF